MYCFINLLDKISQLLYFVLQKINNIEYLQYYTNMLASRQGGGPKRVGSDRFAVGRVGCGTSWKSAEMISYVSMCRAIMVHIDGGFNLHRCFAYIVTAVIDSGGHRRTDDCANRSGLVLWAIS